MLRILKTALVCYAAGTAIGTAAAWAAWAVSSHEHRYRIPDTYRHRQS